jgi:integrase
MESGKRHAKEDHKYERNPALPEWHGWHAARRGLGSNLYRLGVVPDKVIQAILGHSNVNVSLAYYVKSASSDVLAAMGRFEQHFGCPTVRDTDRTPKADQIQRLHL